MAKKNRVPFKPSEEIRAKVLWVTKANKDGTSRQELIRQHARSGSRLRVKFEDDGEAAVYLEKPGGFLRKDQHYQIGYLRNSTAYNARRWMDEGRELYLEVLNVTGGTKDKPTCGVNFAMYASEPK